MSAINELKETLEHTQTAEFVTTMLRDISATKLQSIRVLFDANLAYFKELHELMALVQSYAGETKPSSGEQKKPQRVYVALTSNKRFYGTLNHEIIHMLEASLVKDNGADCLVIGQTGRQIIEIAPLSKTPQLYACAKDEPTEKELFEIVSSLSSYQEIFIIHPTFINSFQQHALTTDMTHVLKKTTSLHKRSIDYIFEPDIPKIILFFQTQIRLVLFTRVMLETRLALTGARLMKMQRAREKAGELVLVQRRIIHKETSTVGSMRLLEAFAGFGKRKSV
jgi:ATP synthase F1 gamma subunit